MERLDPSAFPADRSIGALRAQVDETLGRAGEVASIVEQQLVALADVGAATDGRRIELAMLGMRAHALAEKMDAVFDEALARGAIGLQNCFETRYASRRDGERPWAVFTYARDTGIVYNDLSVALFARDHRVGTIRIIYDADAV